MIRKKIPVERRQELHHYILQKGSCTIDELSKKFNVSKITIHRDIAKLEQRGKIKSTHGGVMPVITEKEIFFDKKKTLHLAEKTAIAHALPNFIDDGSTIFMNSGSTSLEIARVLLQAKKNIRVITNNYEIPPLNLLESLTNNKVVLLGGEYHATTHSFFGSLPLSQLDNMFASCCILGVNGLSLHEGLTTSDILGVSINIKFIQQTKGKIIAAIDSSKLNAVSSFKICNISTIDILFTDWGASSDFIAHAKKQGIKVIIASKISTL